MEKEKLKNEIEKSKKWVAKKKITYSKKFKVINGHHNDMKDTVVDKNGFFLIKIYPGKKEIGVAFVDNSSFEIQFEVRGKKSQEIYNTLFNELNVKVRLDHAAYLGKELKKAEIALETGEEYLQE